jgi:hypothetical protein
MLNTYFLTDLKNMLYHHATKKNAIHLNLNTEKENTEERINLYSSGGEVPRE